MMDMERKEKEKGREGKRQGAKERRRERERRRRVARQLKSQTLFMASLVENASQDSLDKLIRRENVTTTDTRHPRTGKAQTHSSYTQFPHTAHTFERPDTFELLRMEMQIGEAYKHFSAIIISLIEAETCPRTDALTSHREYPVSSSKRAGHISCEIREGIHFTPCKLMIL